MANRYEGEGASRSQRDDRDELRNLGRSEWDNDHGNGSGDGRARRDDHNGQGRFSTQGYYDDRANQQASAGRGGQYDRDWSRGEMQSTGGRYGYDQGDNGGWRGRGGYTEGGWRGQRGFGQGGFGTDPGYSGGFGGGSMGYAANRDYRRDRGVAEGNYGGANLRSDANHDGWNEANGPRSYGQLGTMRGQSAFGSTGQGDYGPYSTDWAQSGRMAGGPMSHHDEDYHHWRSQQIGKLDKDYEAWRTERRQKFSDELEKWRSSRPQNADDETLANANPRASGNNHTATGTSPSGSSRSK